MQIVIRTEKDRKKKNDPDAFSVKVIMCRPDTSMEGEKFSGRQCRFSVVMAAVTGTDVEEWE